MFIFGWVKEVKEVGPALDCHCYRCQRKRTWEHWKEIEWVSFFLIRAFPEKTESGGIPMRTRIGFKIRAGKEASMGWGSRIRRICGHA